MINETPYPRLGEVVHFVTHAFGLFGSENQLSQRLNRFAQDSDFNLATANRLIEEALLIPLRRVDPAAAIQVKNWLTQLLEDYKTLVLTVPADVADRRTLLRILPYELFIPRTMLFLNQLPVSPDVSRWFEPIDTTAIKEVLSWFRHRHDMSEQEWVDLIGHHYEIDETESRDLLTCWQKDHTLLDIHSLLDFKMAGKPEIRHLVLWLILAKAWEYTLQSVGKRFGYEATWSFIEIVQAVYQEQLTGFRPEHTAVQATLLSEINELYQMSDLRDSFKKHCLRPLSQISLTQEKVAGDKERAHTTLKRIEQHALFPHFRYRVEQGWGRYYALCASYEAAFKHYQKAVEHGLYRAGPVLREILRELLVLAVFLDEPAIIKRYYRWSCVMGLFSGEGDAPEDWEIKALRKAFLNEFPLAGLYQG